MSMIINPVLRVYISVQAKERQLDVPKKNTWPRKYSSGWSTTVLKYYIIKNLTKNSLFKLKPLVSFRFIIKLSFDISEKNFKFHKLFLRQHGHTELVINLKFATLST